MNTCTDLFLLFKYWETFFFLMDSSLKNILNLKRLKNSLYFYLKIKKWLCGDNIKDND